LGNNFKDLDLKKEIKEDKLDNVDSEDFGRRPMHGYTIGS
jgi:hypothetical protein